MFKLLLRYILFSLYVGAPVISSAQQHNHSSDENEKPERMWIKDAKAKHGGDLVKTGRYNLEVVINAFHPDEKLSLYLYKGKREMSLKDASGYVSLNYKNRTQASKKLVFKTDRMVLDSLDVSQPVNLEFKITINNSLISAIYYYQGLK